MHAELNCSSFPRQHVTVFKRYSLASTFRTDDACHCPPRGVVMPRAFSVSDLMQRSRARSPYLMDNRQYIGCVLIRQGRDAATALLRAFDSLGLAKTTPRSFAAASAAFRL
jgi:hypothetical protein